MDRCTVASNLSRPPGEQSYVAKTMSLPTGIGLNKGVENAPELTVGSGTFELSEPESSEPSGRPFRGLNVGTPRVREGGGGAEDGLGRSVDPVAL